MSRKIVKKVVAVIMVSSLLNPLVGSLTVVASEYEALNIDNNIEEHQNKELKDSVEPAIEDEQEESVHIDEENDREDAPAQIQTENKAGDSSETEFENNEEVFSAEDVREKAIQMMETEKNNATTFIIRARSLSKTEAFINAVSSYAITIANEYNLYPSVMIAQAALESAWGTSILAYTPNHNLFGIKGQYNGQYFSKYTKEYDQKKVGLRLKRILKSILVIKKLLLITLRNYAMGPIGTKLIIMVLGKKIQNLIKIQQIG
ncbi:glucosaminidase domain-containing protein [Desemzia sp. C1]|nr:glucosaminidase domain-containing protein [Desemzia sp. C1]